MGYNPVKSTWMNPNIEYLFNVEIIEYDMRDAGFSIIKHFKLLPQEEIGRLSSIDKSIRMIEIGKLQRCNKNLSKSLLDKFAEMRELFILDNSLTDNDIISVKKDAIYTTKVCNNLQFNGIDFVAKNKYSSYIRFTDNMNIELYYNMGRIDIKGIGDISIKRHRLYILTFMQQIFSYLESKNPSIKRYIRKFIDDYKGGKLEDGFYMEFNRVSKTINPLYNYTKVIIPITQIIVREVL